MPHTLSHSASGINLIDRGPSVDFDFTTPTFIKDGLWHDLDCSTIVPPGATWILFLALIRHSKTNQAFKLKKKTYPATFNTEPIQTIGGAYVYRTLFVQCDPNRILTYLLSAAGTWNDVCLVVRGWII